MDAMSFWFRSPIIDSKRENKLFFIKLATIFGLEFSLWVRFLLFVSRYLAFIVNHNYTTIWGILFDFSNHLKQIYISFFYTICVISQNQFPKSVLFFWFPNLWHVHESCVLFLNQLKMLRITLACGHWKIVCRTFVKISRFFFVLKTHSPPLTVLNMELAARWASFNGQSTYPHVRYHDKEGLNKI